MAGLSMAERVKLTVLMGRRAVRNLAGRVRGHPLIRWNFMPGKADRLVIAPQDLRTADGTRASEIYAGRFAFAGKVVICDGRSPFEIEPPSEEWAAGAFGFGWLRHLRAAESGITRANARALVDEWITLHRGKDGRAQRRVTKRCWPSCRKISAPKFEGLKGEALEVDLSPLQRGRGGRGGGFGGGGGGGGRRGGDAADGGGRPATDQ